MGTRYCPDCESEDIKYAGIVDGNFDLICRCLSCGHRWHQMKDQYIKYYGLGEKVKNGVSSA